MTLKQFLRPTAFVALAILCRAAVVAEAQSESEPGDVLKQFCELDTAGGQLNETGWRQTASFFTAPTEPARRVVVVQSYVVSTPAMRSNRAELYVEYIVIGEIDRRLARFLSLPGIKVRNGFDLSAVAAENGTALEWRIEGSPPEPHLTVAAAIRYTRETRDASTDAVVKKKRDGNVGGAEPAQIVRITPLALALCALICGACDGVDKTAQDSISGMLIA